MWKLNSANTLPLVLSAIAAILSVLALLFATGILEVRRASSHRLETQTRDYLLRSPEVILEAVRRHDDRQQAKEENELKTAVRERRDELFNDPASPVGGNPQGDVTIVEFFDYNCPYCRKAAPILTETERTDPGLRVVYKEFPILGPGSKLAARAALAARKQGRYLEVHNAMMGYSGATTENSTLQLAQDLGLDVARLKQDMEDPEIAKRSPVISN